MMKFIKYILCLLVVSGVALSCTNDDNIILEGADQAPNISASGPEELVLESDNADQEATTFSWDELSLNANTPVKYILEMALADTGFKEVSTLLNSSDNSLSMTVKELNAQAMKLGIEPDSTGQLAVRVIAQIGSSNGKQLISEPY